MRLQVCCNGDKEGKGKCLAIYAYLLKGEYDHYLHWPFHGSIKVEIKSLLKNAHHHTQIITFGGKPHAGNRVEEDDECCSQAKSCGYWNFMPFSELIPGVNPLSECYIKNECLKIDVSR